MGDCLYIMADVSGSMNEMGKIHLLRNLCRYAAQLLVIDPERYSGANICFCQWSQGVSEMALQGDGDIPALNAKGSSNLCVLADFLSQHRNTAGSTMALVLSDGNFPCADIADFQRKLSPLAGLRIRTVAVGADAHLRKLEKIATNNTVYLAENIASAIESAILDSDEPLKAPESTADIMQSVPTEPEEPEEDWDA